MSGFLDPSTKEQIRSANDIVELIGSYFPLKRAGASFVAVCPFHREKTPSFHVSPQRQTFHCFGCHKGGDVFKFVQEYESVTFMEAVQRLAQRAGIVLQYRDGGGADPAQHLKERLRDLHEQITRRWQTALQTEAGGQIARDYLARRGVPESAVKLFRLGYAPEAWDDTVHFCTGKGFDQELAQQAGLVIRKEDTGRCYDRFRGRLMFPICDEQGRVIAFSGRILQGDEKTAKYVNSPETPIFSKSRVFYGLDKTKRGILDAGFAVICEGQLDLIACFEAGVKNVVAPQGTAFTTEHARILRRYTEEVVLCFDSDNAGQNAAVRVFDSLLAAGFAIRVALIPAPDDPDSYIKTKGAEAFHQLIRGAAGFFDFYLDRLCRQNDVGTDKGRLTVLREMGVAVQKTGNSVLSDTYAQKTAIRLGVSAESVRLEFRKHVQGAKGGASATGESSEWDGLEQMAEAEAGVEAVVPVEPPTKDELDLLKLLVAGDDVLPWAREHLQLEWIRHGVVRSLVEMRLMSDEQGRFPTVVELMDRCTDEYSKGLLSSVAVQQRTLPKVGIQVYDLMTRLRNQMLDRDATMLKQSLAGAVSGEAAQVILERLQQIRKDKLLKMPAPELPETR